MRTLIFAVLLSFVYSITNAGESEAELESLPEAPAPPAPVHSGEAIEPDITIVRRDKKTIQEFRRGGRLYMIKVIPDIGPAYYFLDTNADGKLDVRSSDPDYGSRINMWKIFEWD